MATNGLSVSDSKVKLGGTLIENTTINQDGKTLSFLNGDIQIGTTTTAGTVTINSNDAGGNTGLRLPNGAAAGNILTSDATGSTSWKPTGADAQYQTMVLGSWGEQYFSVTDPNISDNEKITFFNDITFDRAQQVFGANYGWNVTNQEYTVPVTGIYRISMNMYFMPVTNGLNHRVYVYRNNTMLQDPGIISITDSGGHQSAFVMGLVRLNKDDVIDFRVWSKTAPITTRLWGGVGHTYFMIESL